MSAALFIDVLQFIELFFIKREEVERWAEEAGIELPIFSHSHEPSHAIFKDEASATLFKLRWL